MARPWDEMSIQFELRDARVVAILKGGGAVVEQGLVLSFIEGRHESYESRGEDQPMISRLDYHGSFEVAGDSGGLTGEAAKAQIVIEGTHSNGRRLEIRGEGWLGYDERGRIEGTFTEAPDMMIDEVEDDEEDEASEPAVPRKEWEALIAEVRPRPSQQFVRAMVGCSFPDNDV